MLEFSVVKFFVFTVVNFSVFSVVEFLMYVSKMSETFTSTVFVEYSWSILYKQVLVLGNFYKYIFPYLSINVNAKKKLRIFFFTNLV